jgi:CheY-like chemotaxis protein
LAKDASLARKILLADDSVTAQNMGRKILSDAGYDVVTVNNGSAALKRVAELKPDLVVLDVYMPGYSGLEVCQRLKDSPDTERIPVLLTVGKLEPFKPEEARRVRADAYIIKPFEASELLTALARMEDRMVPGKSEVSRFGDGGSRKSENDGDADTGWKNRLRFPSKKKKEEPEPDVDADLVGPSFRNFRRGKSKASSSSTGKAAAAPPEPRVVPDIPRDITPEELDALSALAAKLDGPAAVEDKVAAAVETAPPVEAKAEFKVAATVGEEPIAGEVPVAHVEPQGEGETPATSAVPEASAPAIEVEPVAVSEVKSAETVQVETLAAAEPAPVDRDDEPAFAIAASAVEPVPQEQIAEPVPQEVPQEEKIEVPEVPTTTSETAATANPPGTIEIQTNAEEQQPVEPRPEESKVEEVPQVVETVKTEESPVAGVAPKIEEPPKPEERGEAIPVPAAAEEAEVGPAPSEEELAAALRLLTPALGHTDPSSMPTRETLVAAGAMLAEEAARNASSEAPRWVAAAVAVSPEEAALSLETEMFRTLAGTSVVESDSAVPVATAAMSPPAVESEAAAEVKAEIPAEAPAETMAAVPNAASEAVAHSVEAVEAEQKASPATVAEEEAAEELVAVEQKGSPALDSQTLDSQAEDPQAQVAQEAEAVEEPAMATFADAMQHDEIEAAFASPSTDPASNAAVPAEEVRPPVGEMMEVPTSEAAEDEEAMAKERAKTGKSNWHQIRTGSVAAATPDVVEAAKQAEPVEEAPKAMAAAAAADSAPAAALGPDASAIASIVDSVLADLRPKIVEEIAKKLAGR